MSLTKYWDRCLVMLPRNLVTVHTSREAAAIAKMFTDAAEHLAEHERREAERLGEHRELAAGRATNVAFAETDAVPFGRPASVHIDACACGRTDACEQHDPPLDVA